MTDQELLQAMEQMMDRKLQPINERLDTIDQRLDTIEENLGEVRTGVNTLLRWAEKVGDSIDFPLPKII